ncbi:MAG: hypothetical protein LBV74_20760 [Tannerella sp.]|nr:hypothetical protein [Tannerella sp.]
MKHLIFTAIIIFFSVNACSQKDVGTYYKYVNKAELAICDQKYAEAGEYYKKAFVTGVCFIRDLTNAFDVSLLNEDREEETVHYAHLLAQMGHYSQADSTDNPTLFVRLKTVYDTSKKTFNQAIMDELNQLQEEDQADRKSGCAYQDTCKSKVNVRDSLRWQQIERLYAKYGDLNEGSAGRFFHNRLHLILLHNTGWLRFPHDFLLGQIILGNFDAREYAYLYDRYYSNNIAAQQNHEEFTKFGTEDIWIIGQTLFINHNEKAMLQINENRKAIFLEPIADYTSKMICQFVSEGRDNHFLFYQYVIWKNMEEKEREWKENMDLYKDTEGWDLRYFENHDFNTE